MRLDCFDFSKFWTTDSDYKRIANDPQYIFQILKYIVWREYIWYWFHYRLGTIETKIIENSSSIIIA